MRILHFIQSGLQGGGIETYLQHLLATASSDLEHEVVVASGEGYVLSQGLPVHQIRWSAESEGGAEDGRRAMELIVARDGVPLFHDVPSETTLNACRARGLLVAILCHGHQWWCGSATRFHSRTGRTCEIRATTPRCLIRYHALRCGGRRLAPVMREMRRASTGRRALREASRILVASGYMAGQAEMHGAPRLRVRRLPLPTPFAGAGPLPRADDPPIVFYPSRLTSLKGIEPTLEAFARIRADARLVVAGTGILAGRVAAAVAAHPARDRIHLAGHLNLDGLREAFGRAAVVVMPVLWPEPFGLVGIEALALGRPVVATYRGGIGEWAHEELGVLRITRPTPSLLAEAIERVLTDPSWGMRARERGSPWVDERHSMKAHVESLRAALDPLRPRADARQGPPSS